MTEYRWQDVRDRACVLFNDTPRDVQEDAVAEAFMKRPKAVIDKIEEIGQAVKNGRISYGWPLMAKLAKGLGEGLGESALVASDSADREKHMRLAKIWLRNVGWMYPFRDMEDALFGDGGRLSMWREDMDAVEEILTMYAGIEAEKLIRRHPRLSQEEVSAEAYRGMVQKVVELTMDERRELVRKHQPWLGVTTTVGRVAGGEGFSFIADDSPYPPYPPPEETVDQPSEEPVPTTFDGNVR